MTDLELRRREAIRELGAAVAAERISIEQFETRLAHVQQATNVPTLDAIVADLTPTGSFPASHLMTRTMPIPRDLIPVEPADELRIATVLSSSKRAGSWTVPLKLQVKVVLGDLTIDLRDAVFCSDFLDIELNMLLGGFTLIVPAGAQVENECEERMSSVTHSTRSTLGGEGVGLLIRLSGHVRWSNMEIKEKRRPGEEPMKGLKKLLGKGR